MAGPRTHRRPVALTAIGASALAIVITIWLAWPDGQATHPRQRQYKATTACLLTDNEDLSGALAKASWAGIQEASEATLIKVQHLAISGPQTPENGLTFYNSLGVQRCTVIVAAGAVPVAAMTSGYRKFPGSKHAVVGGNAAEESITAVDTSSPETIRSGVKAAVSTAA
jgi:hypothetical protein